MAGVCVHNAVSIDWRCMHRSCEHGWPLGQYNQKRTGPCRKCARQATESVKILAREYGLPWPEMEEA